MKPIARLASGVALALLLLAAAYLSQPGGPATTTATAGQAIDWTTQADGSWVETGVSVYRVLSDDNKGSRHQRLLVRDQAGHSLLIAHNIDLAPRVPVAVGDTLLIRGQFESNDKGGVIHWTHHDPQGRHTGGYIEHAGRRYR